MALRAEDRDPTVDPGVDFYRYANGGWLDANPIPPEYGAWGSFEELNEHNEGILRGILERAASDPADEIDQLVGDYFAAGMDVEAIATAGIDPIRPFLERIDGMTDHAELMDVVAQLHRSGVFALFGLDVDPDFDDATRNQLWLAQAGLGLPDRDAYFAEGDASASLRVAYRDHVGAQLAHVGVPGDAVSDLAAGVLELETRLAGEHLRRQDVIDPAKILNRHDRAALDALAPDLALPTYLDAVGADGIEEVNVQNPALLAALAGIVEATDLEVIRAYLRFHVVRTFAGALPTAIEDEEFAFYGRRVGGQTEQRDRWKRVLAAVTGDIGEALSQRYVAVAFSPAAKSRALTMVEGIVAEMRRSLQGRTWMTDATRSRGIAKLDAMGIKIGYPDRWRDWSGLELARDSFAANRLRALQFELRRKLGQLHEPVDETEFLQPPHIVNAYYHPTRNEIVFPAGILQPPFFDAEADDALNYGGIGTVIAHEITHGFDTKGRQFDGDGAYRDWWTPDDEAAFMALADRLASQFDEYVIIDDVHVNGQLTLGENIADLGGVAVAQRAHARVAADHPDLDNLTPAQRFFLAFATLWRGNISDELARTYAQIDPHSPRNFRVLGPLANCDAFAEAFDLGDAAPMMRPPTERIEIW